jgi:site-specific DNA recombinase
MTDFKPARMRAGAWLQIATMTAGSREPPALQKLLADVQAGKITIVVVSDRLTRALADFAKLVELFDQLGVSFVSITQSFNTTSSMGPQCAALLCPVRA